MGQQKGKSQQRFLKNISLALVSIIVFLAIFEASFRIFNYFASSSGQIMISPNKKLLFEHRPSIAFTSRHKIKERFNSLGFIGGEIDPRAKQIRILGLGDSITEGLYLEEKDRYLSKVAEFLQPGFTAPVVAINAAVAGYNTLQERELLKTRGLSVSPHLIIVGICLNDAVRYMPQIKDNILGGVIVGIRDGSKARYFDFLYQRSDFYKFVYDIYARQSARMRTSRDFDLWLKKYKYRVNPQDLPEWKKEFAGIMEISRINRIPVLFVIFPLRNQLVQSENLTFQPLTEFLSDNHAYFIDLIGEFLQEFRQGNGLYLDYDTIHLNKEGHKLAARAIADYITAHHLLDNPPAATQ